MILRALVIVLVSAGFASLTNAQPAEQKPAAQVFANELSSAFRLAAERVQPSIVLIETHAGPRSLMEWSKHESRKTNGAARDKLEDDDSQASQDAIRDSFSTGIVFDARGYVLHMPSQCR